MKLKYVDDYTAEGTTALMCPVKDCNGYMKFKNDIAPFYAYKTAILVTVCDKCGHAASIHMQLTQPKSGGTYS